MNTRTARTNSRSFTRDYKAPRSYKPARSRRPHKSSRGAALMGGPVVGERVRKRVRAHRKGTGNGQVIPTPRVARQAFKKSLKALGDTVFKESGKILRRAGNRLERLAH